MRSCHSRDCRWRLRQQHKVVAKTQIPAAPQVMPHELLQRVQLDVDEELTVEVASRQAPIRRGAQQGLVRWPALDQTLIALAHRLVPAVVAHPLCGEPARCRGVLEPPIPRDAHEVVAEVPWRRLPLAAAWRLSTWRATVAGPPLPLRQASASWLNTRPLIFSR